jgi:hypothetical protein
MVMHQTPRRDGGNCDCPAKRAGGYGAASALRSSHPGRSRQAAF